MTTELDEIFFADDSFERWAALIGEAEESLVLMSPRLDTGVQELLNHCEIPGGDVKILTTLRPEVGIEGYRQHLLTLSSLLSDEYDVRVTHRPLRATTVIRDGVQLTVGSQDLTMDSRSGDHIAIFPGNDIKDSDLANTLGTWVSESRCLTLEAVAYLLEELEAAMDQVVLAHRRLLDDFERADAAVLALLPEPLGQAHEDYMCKWVDILDDLDSGPLAEGIQEALTTPELVAPTRAWARLAWASDWEYKTLLAWREADLTRWRLPRGDGTMSDVTLNRLHIYPIILNPAGRMAFARVAQTRITYLRYAVAWTEPILVGNRNYSVRVNFPREGLSESNVHLELRSLDGSRGVLLRVRFDGLQGTLQGFSTLQDGTGEVGTASPAFAISELSEVLEDPHELQNLLQKSLRPFKYKTLGRDDHNASEFFPPGWLRLNLFRFGDCSILAASSV